MKPGTTAMILIPKGSKPPSRWSWHCRRQRREVESLKLSHRQRNWAAELNHFWNPSYLWTTQYILLIFETNLNWIFCYNTKTPNLRHSTQLKFFFKKKSMKVILIKRNFYWENLHWTCIVSLGSNIIFNYLFSVLVFFPSF